MCSSLASDSAMQFFVMGEVASALFQQPPNAFVQELRKGKYPKTTSSAADVLQAVVHLGLQVEGSASHAGVMLLPPATVEALLQDKRRLDLLQPFRLAMLKLASQVHVDFRRGGDSAGSKLQLCGVCCQANLAH